MKRLHLIMMLVVLVFVGVFLGGMFGGRRGAHGGAAAGAVLAGALLWVIAPAECRRQLHILERQRVRLADPDTFRARFIRGARTPALVLILLGLAALILFLSLG